MHSYARFTLVGNPSTLDLCQEFVDVESIHSIEAQPWSRLFYEPIGGLEFDSAIVWMKDPTIAENLRLSGISNVFRADPFPAYGHAADHLLRTLKLARPNLPDLWSPAFGDIVVHAGSGSAKKNWAYFDTLVEELENTVLLLGPSPSGRGQGERRKSDEDLRPSPALRAASPNGRGVQVLENLSLTEGSLHLRKCR